MNSWWKKIKDGVASSIISQKLQEASKQVLPLLAHSAKRVASSVVGRAVKNASKKIMSVVADSVKHLASSPVGNAVKTAAQQVIGIPVVANSITWFSSSFAGKIVGNISKQVVAIPLVIEAISTPSKTQDFFFQIVRVASENYMLVAVVNSMNQMLQSYVQEHYLASEDERTSLEMSGVFVLQSALYLLDTAVTVYYIRSLLEGAARGIVLSTQVSTALAVEKGKLHPIDGAESLEPLCKNCPGMLKGIFRDLTAYYFTEFGILLAKQGLRFSQMNYMGIPNALIEFFSMCHQARYILTLVSGGVCNTHLMGYLRVNFDLVVSVGLMNFLMSKGLIHALKTYSDVPSEFYEGIISQFMIFVNISMAAHMNKPNINQSGKPDLKQAGLTPQQFDFIDKYQTLIGEWFDKMVINKKEIIATLSRQWPFSSKQPSMIPWRTMRAGLVKVLLDNQYARQCWRGTLQMLLPTMLQTMDGFINDPLVKPIWTEFSPPIIQGLWYLGKIQEYRVLQFTEYAQAPLAYTLDHLIGTPVFLNKLLLRLLIYKPFIEAVGELRRAFEWRQERQCSLPKGQKFYPIQMPRDYTTGSLFSEEGIQLEAERRPFLLSDEEMLAPPRRQLRDDQMLSSLSEPGQIADTDILMPPHRTFFESNNDSRLNSLSVPIEVITTNSLTHGNRLPGLLDDKIILLNSPTVSVNERPRDRRHLNDADILSNSWNSGSNRKSVLVSDSKDAFFSTQLTQRRVGQSVSPSSRNGL